MRKLAALSSVLLVLAAPLARGAEGETKAADRRQETYESPLLSLLLLPVSVLIKVASLVGGEESTKDERPKSPEHSPR
jgi:hypothetical protein